MKITYKLEIEDAVALADHHYKKSMTGFKKNFFKYIGIILIILGIGFIAQGKTDTISFLYLVLGFFLVIFEPLILRKIVKRSTSSVYLKGKNSEVFCKNTLEVNKSTVKLKSPNSEVKQTIKSLESFEENENYFFLYNTSQTAFIIPKRCFKNKKEIKEFKKYFI